MLSQLPSVLYILSSKKPEEVSTRGVSEGALEGFDEGSEEGSEDGALEGSAEGVLLGPPDGSEDGSLEGSVDGYHLERRHLRIRSRRVVTSVHESASEGH